MKAMRSRMDSAAPPNKVPWWLDWSGQTMSTTDISGAWACAVLLSASVAAVGAGCAVREEVVELGKRWLLQKEGKAPGKKRANQGEAWPWAHKAPGTAITVMAILAQGHPALSHKNRPAAGLLALGSPCAITFPAKKPVVLNVALTDHSCGGSHSLGRNQPFCRSLFILAAKQETAGRWLF